MAWCVCMFNKGEASNFLLDSFFILNIHYVLHEYMYMYVYVRFDFDLEKKFL